VEFWRTTGLADGCWQLAIKGDSEHDYSNYSECASSGVGVVPGNFLSHLVFFPAAYILAGEEFGVVAAVACITAIA
jgi:hypothetical protein